MKIKKYDAYIQVKLPLELKKIAEKKLASMGYSMSEFIREKLEEVVKNNKEE